MSGGARPRTGTATRARPGSGPSAPRGRRGSRRAASSWSGAAPWVQRRSTCWPVPASATSWSSTATSSSSATCSASCCTTRPTPRPGHPRRSPRPQAVGRINAGVEVDAVVADVTPANVEATGRPRRRRGRRHGQPRDALPAQRRLREGGHPLGLRRRGRLDRDVDDDPARRDGLLPVPVPDAPAGGHDGDLRDGGRARVDRRDGRRDAVDRGREAPRRRPRAPQPRPHRVRRVDERPPPGRGRAPAAGLPVLRRAPLRVPRGQGHEPDGDAVRSRRHPGEPRSGRSARPRGPRRAGSQEPGP